MEPWVVAIMGVALALLGQVVLVVSFISRLGARVDALNEKVSETMGRIERGMTNHNADNQRDNAVIFERLDTHNQRLSMIEGELKARREHNG